MSELRKLKNEIEELNDKTEIISLWVLDDHREVIKDKLAALRDKLYRKKNEIIGKLAELSKQRCKIERKLTKLLAQGIKLDELERKVNE